jgi:hypothetical protein
MATASDPFTRADNADLGADWAVQTGTAAAKIVSNAVRATTLNDSAVERYTSISPGAGQFARCTIKTITSASAIAEGVCLRMAAGAETYYDFLAFRNFGTLTSAIRRWSTGSSIDVVTENATTWVAGDVLTAVVRGSNLYLFRNGVLLLSGANGDIASGDIGLSIYIDSGSLADAEIDDWSGGDLPIAFVNAGAEGDAGSGNVTLGAPASPATDNIWIAVVHSSDNVAHSFTDWTQIVQGNGAATSRLSVWYFRYAGVTPNLIVGHTAGAGISGGIAQFSGCKTSGSPVNVSSAIANGTDNSIEHTTVTPSVDNCLLLVCNGAADDNARTTPTGYAVAFTHVGTLGNPDESSSMMYRDAMAGATGTVTITQAAADPWTSTLIALEPEAVSASASITPPAGTALIAGVASRNDRGMPVPTEINIQ